LEYASCKAQTANGLRQPNDPCGISQHHKVTLSTGRSGIVLDLVIEKGNPADSTLTMRSAKRHAVLFGEPPERAAFDGAFASKDNLQALQASGTRETCFSNPLGCRSTSRPPRLACVDF